MDGLYTFASIMVIMAILAVVSAVIRDTLHIVPAALILMTLFSTGTVLYKEYAG